MNKENILEIDNLERSYSTVMPDGETKVYSVLRGISFQVKRGEFIGIMGSSGSPGPTPTPNNLPFMLYLLQNNLILPIIYLLGSIHVRNHT